MSISISRFRSAIIEHLKRALPKDSARGQRVRRTFLFFDHNYRVCRNTWHGVVVGAQQWIGTLLRHAKSVYMRRRVRVVVPQRAKSLAKTILYNLNLDGRAREIVARCQRLALFKAIRRALNARSERRRLTTELAHYARVRLPQTHHYDVVCVIAFRGRHDILRLVVHELLHERESDMQVGVVLACDEPLDVSFANDLRGIYEHVGIVITDNSPLGLKWQRAVDCARLANPDFLLITGSDDITTTSFLRKNIRHMRDTSLGVIDMTGPRTWLLVDLGDGEQREASGFWTLSYHYEGHGMPLGAGRIYSREFLQRIDWVLFDVAREVHLDDMGYEKLVELGGMLYNPTLDDGYILSVKGAWSAMNSVEVILNCDTITTRPCNEQELERIRGELTAEVCDYLDRHLSAQSSKVMDRTVSVEVRDNVLAQTI